jgi:hypothetical protein
VHGKPGCVANIKMDLKNMMAAKNWIHVSQIGVKSRVLVNMVLTHCVPPNAWNFLIIRGNTIFCRTARRSR